MMAPEQVIDAYGLKTGQLKLSLRNEAGGAVVQVEGKPADLRLLGHLLLAVADGGDPGFQLGPRGAGSAHFARGARLGVYLLRKSR